MIKIGELSNLTGVSVKTIRYYEEEGLIVPVEVDRWTNYRYYDDSSVNRISQILYLKDLGFSLKEIKNLDDKTIEEKIKTLKAEIIKFTQNIRTLSSLQNQKGEYVMKNFVNDEKVVGKWKKLGIVNSLEEFKNNKIEQSDIFIFDELYFLPQGEQYWVISWTKGTLFVNDRPMPYQIIDGKMLIDIKDKFTNQTNAYVVYEQVDSKTYLPKDIQVKDNVDLPFINDEKLIGFWKVVDFISVDSEFDPKNINWEGELYLKKYSFEPNGNLQMTFSSDKTKNIKWTKGFIIDEGHSTASAYVIKTIDDEDYLTVEWKSGDYIYGGFVSGCYVFKKLK